MKNMISLSVLLLGISGLMGQKPDQSFVKETADYYSTVDASVFRDSRRVVEKGFMKDYKAYGAGVQDKKGSSRQISVDGFETVVEIETHDVFYNDWDVEVGCPTAFPIFENDLIYLTFWIKCLGSRDESNQGSARVYLQQNGPPWQKSADVSILAGSEWIQYKIPFRAQFQHYDTKQAAVAFALGYSHQTIQLADVKVTNLGSLVDEAVLPRTSFTYEGRAADAPWRKQAAERIEKHRKGDLKVVVKDKKGNLIPNAQVNVEMTNHTFGFGNIVSRQAFGNPGPKGEAYRKIVKENFNEVTFENALKHDMWLLHKSEGRLDKTFEVMDTLDKWGIGLRGHVFVWPSSRYTKVAKEYIDKQDKAGLTSLITDHINEIGSATNGRVVDWDVMNEPYINHEFMDLLGDEAVLDWFKLARANQPKADLYINETRFLIDGGVNKNVQDNLYRWAKYIQDNKVDIDGLGFQGHFGETGLTPPDKIIEIFDRFAELGVKMKITELDITTDDEELQADYFRDFYTTVYSHPSANAIVSWGFWEDAHWRPSAAWYRSDFSEKKIAKVHRDLVYKEWWTNEQGKTASNGQFSTRGFCGKYTITVKSGNKETITKTVLSKDGNTVEVVLK